MAYIDCENCYHGEVCTYRRASHDKIVLCEHWQPTADVVEVKHGKWLHKKIDKINYYVYGQCSNCLERKRIDNYCPNCGAKMDGGAK